MSYPPTDQYTGVTSNCPMGVDPHPVDGDVEIILSDNRTDGDILRLVIDNRTRSCGPRSHCTTHAPGSSSTYA